MYLGSADLALSGERRGTCKDLAGRLNKRAYLRVSGAHHFSQLVSCWVTQSEMTAVKMVFITATRRFKKVGGALEILLSPSEAMKDRQLTI